MMQNELTEFEPGRWNPHFLIFVERILSKILGIGVPSARFGTNCAPHHNTSAAWTRPEGFHRGLRGNIRLAVLRPGSATQKRPRRSMEYAQLDCLMQWVPLTMTQLV